jgi:hypothetical protein
VRARRYGPYYCLTGLFDVNMPIMYGESPKVPSLRTTSEKETRGHDGNGKDEKFCQADENDVMMAALGACK